MPILTLQKRVRELGRIRIGEVATGANGRKRPAKLGKFRLTSASRELLEKVAALYGGEVRAWTPANGGPAAWEVYTDAKRLPILVPPQPVSQYYELWSGGGCQRRCDGETELLSDKACVCSPDPEERECKPTTRLNVVLRDVEGIGVWRLESHGYYAAVELPEVAEFLARAGGYISAWLSLEERVTKRIRDGKSETRRFMVPALEVDITPAALLGGGKPAPVGITGPTPERAALPPASVRQDEDSMLVAIAQAPSREVLRQIWEDAGRSGARMTGALQAAFAARSEALAQESVVVQAEIVDDGPTADELWPKILANAPEGWSTEDVEIAFERATGVDAGVASATDMARYLAQQGR
ncbi:hypothetical protein [Actinokineospora globicatena]|uniref:Uncharacterized protein n=1 Tax=Actinokineospora globicatena TaxID=103729 RepID=A0A9W6QIQ4_9PSEU|nr:hypothetical protein [Actinokineospora globicatena]GLW91816.1 hypothetical protein Aglo03_26320 [Actinokineospora globicatena]